MFNTKKELKEIKAMLTQVCGETVQKSKKYEETIDLLSLIKINASKVSINMDKKTASFGVSIEYSIPPINLVFDGDGETLINERFRAINLLGLCSIEDQIKISEKIQEAKLKNKEGTN